MRTPGYLNYILLFLVAGGGAFPVDSRAATAQEIRSEINRMTPEQIKAAISAICPEHPSGQLTIARKTACKERGRLTSFEPNYLIFLHRVGDDNSYEAHYSFRYLFTEPDCMSRYRSNILSARGALYCLQAYEMREEFYFTYTGEFDFYLGTRHSGPVINRISNPALHWRFHHANWEILPKVRLRWLDLGLQHRSNGQVVEATEKVTDPTSADFGRYKTQVAYENNNYSYFDSLSRSANYFSAETKLEINYQNAESLEECRSLAKCYDLWFSAKIYGSQEADITWGPDAGKGLDYADYDRIRLIVSKKFYQLTSWIKKPQLDLILRVGDKGLSTKSYDVELLFPCLIRGKYRVPVFVKYHNGPMSTLSNYTTPQNSIGIGVQLM